MNSASKPLRGVRVLVGRAQHQAGKLSSRLQDIGAQVVEIPFIEIRPPRSYKPLDAALKRINQYDWLILTSVNGVKALEARLKQLRISRKDLAHLRIAAIGPATRAQIEKLDLQVSIVPPRYVAESVVESLRRKVNGKRVLLARAKVARDVIPRELRTMGAKVDVVELYETVIPLSSKKKLQLLMRDPARRPRIVTFTSSSTVSNFLRLLGGNKRQSKSRIFNGVQFASIGPVTSATLRKFNLPVDIEASEYTIDGLTKAIERSLYNHPDHGL